MNLLFSSIFPQVVIFFSSIFGVEDHPFFPANSWLPQVSDFVGNLGLPRCWETFRGQKIRLRWYLVTQNLRTTIAHLNKLYIVCHYMNLWKNIFTYMCICIIYTYITNSHRLNIYVYTYTYHSPPPELFRHWEALQKKTALGFSDGSEGRLRKDVKQSLVKTRNFFFAKTNHTKLDGLLWLLWLFRVLWLFWLSWLWWLLLLFVCPSFSWLSFVWRAHVSRHYSLMALLWTCDVYMYTYIHIFRYCFFLHVGMCIDQLPLNPLVSCNGK